MFKRLYVTYTIIVRLIIVLIFFASLLLCVYYFSRKNVAGKKCYLALQFSRFDEGNFTGKLNQFPRLISHVRSRIYNTRRIPCVYNYETTCGKRFNIASEIGEEDREGTFRLAAVIKFSQPLLVYLRQTEPQVNLKFALFGVILFSLKVINYSPEILNPSYMNLNCPSTRIISQINKHCSVL